MIGVDHHITLQDQHCRRYDQAKVSVRLQPGSAEVHAWTVSGKTRPAFRQGFWIRLPVKRGIGGQLEAGDLHRESRLAPRMDECFKAADSRCQSHVHSWYILIVPPPSFDGSSHT
ncbi:hypothetical protein D3C80_1532890 [compost metagenome]